MSADGPSSGVPKARFCICDWDEARGSTPDKEVVIRPITETATIILPRRFTFDSRMYFVFRKIKPHWQSQGWAAFFRSRSISAMIRQCKRLHCGLNLNTDVSFHSREVRKADTHRSSGPRRTAG